MSWVLVERRQTGHGWSRDGVAVFADEAEPTGEDVRYFMCWTGIGPASTNDPAEAARFPSEAAALQSPAYSFWLTFFQPEPIDDERR